MGVQNRQRRRQKQARRERESRRGTSPDRSSRSSTGGVFDALPLDMVIASAAEAVHHDAWDAKELVSALVHRPPALGGRKLVARTLVKLLEDEITRLRTKAWHPSEIQRVTQRKLGSTGMTISATAIRGEWLRCSGDRSETAWAAEAASLDEQRWRLDHHAAAWPGDVAVALAVLGLLSHLPALPGCTGRASRPRDSSGTTAPEVRVLEKVRALLAKAESTSYPDEAASLTAKAQELLARHSIDAAALSATDRSARQRTASARRLWIDDPYVGAKGNLVHVVAIANRCRAVLSGDLGLATIAGHDDDLDTVEILFTSLLVQATTQMTAAGSRTDALGRSRTRAFRQSFLVAFATRIGQRLSSASASAESAATETYGSALLPVLASREAAADDLIETIFPEIVKRRTSASDREGWASGTAAADLASLVFQPELANSLGD